VWGGLGLEGDGKNGMVKNDQQANHPAQLQGHSTLGKPQSRDASVPQGRENRRPRPSSWHQAIGEPMPPNTPHKLWPEVRLQKPGGQGWVPQPGEDRRPRPSRSCGS
jgi:hypothetical protein